MERVLGLQRFPDVSTLSRMFKEADAKSVAKLGGLLREMIMDRLRHMDPACITLDFGRPPRVHLVGESGS